MKKHEVAYYDTDGQYAKRLGSYISKKKGVPFFFHVFTDESLLMEYLEREKPEWLLLSDDVKGLCPEWLQYQLIVFMEERNSIGQERFIYKYQSADAIVKELMSFYYEGRELLFQEGFSGVTVECVYSPVRRCGKSTFARKRARELSKEYHTLLVCFDRNRSEPSMGSEELNLSDLLFYYLEMPGELAGKIPFAMEQIDGYDQIRSANRLEDLFAMTDRDWYVFLSTVIELGGYHSVVLDLSLEVRGYEMLLELSQVIYMPCSRNGSDCMLLQKETGMLRRELGEPVYQKIRCVQSEGGENEGNINAEAYDTVEGGSPASN